MGRRQASKKSKVESESEESELEQVDHQEEDSEVDQDDVNIDEDILDGDQIEDNSVILKKIEEKIMDCDEEEKLSWGAIYTIKQQEDVINEQMQREIEAVKEKYEKLRLPLLEKISDAVSGRKLEKSLYTDNELTKSINVNKTKAKAIPEYWSRVFYSCGLISSEMDVEVLDKVAYFRVELIEPSIQHIRVLMEFEDNDLIDNKYELEIKGGKDSSELKVINRVGKAKSAFKADEDASLFGMLLSQESDEQELSETAMDLYRAYVSSTYFYFYDPDQDLEGREDSMDGDAVEEEDDEDEDSEEEVKATKKTKPNPALEKPECKNQ